MPFFAQFFSWLGAMFIEKTIPFVWNKFSHIIEKYIADIKLREKENAIAIANQQAATNYQNLIQNPEATNDQTIQSTTDALNGVQPPK